MSGRLFEFEDLSWFPQGIRQGGTDYLRLIIDLTRVYDPAAEILNKIVNKDDVISDLCSGSGGPLPKIEASLNPHRSTVLSDKFPPREWHSAGPEMHYHPVSVDCISETADGDVITMFSALHHFNEQEVKQILIRQTARNAKIAFFDGGDRSWLMIVAVLLLHPPGFLVLTPFIKPVTRKRLLFTYLLPLIPLMTIWDGSVSIARLYSARKLKEIAEAAVPHYKWEAGYRKTKFGLKMAFLTGIPAAPAD
jgi:hypothetical protein